MLTSEVQAQIDSGNMTLDMVMLGTAAVEGYKDRVTACCAFYETFRDYMQYQGEETVNGFDCKRYDAVFETAAGKQSVTLWIEKDYGAVCPGGVPSGIGDRSVHVKAHLELDASIVHPSGICGPNDYSFGPVAQVVSQYINDEMKIGLEGTFNSVDVRDLAAGVIACCHKGSRGECYIMSSELVTMRELYDIINRAADLDVHAGILSKGVANMAVKLLKVQSKVMGKELLLNEFALYNLTRNNDFDCTKGQRELGFSCRPFEETIRDEVVWLREEAKNAPEVSEETKQTVKKIKERGKMGDIANVIIKKGTRPL